MKALTTDKSIKKIWRIFHQRNELFLANGLNLAKKETRPRGARARARRGTRELVPQEHGIGQTGNVSVLFWVGFSGRVVCCRHAAAAIVVAASRQKGGVGFTTIVAVNVRKLSRISCVAATWGREKRIRAACFWGSCSKCWTHNSPSLRIRRFGCWMSIIRRWWWWSALFCGCCDRTPCARPASPLPVFFRYFSHLPPLLSLL